MPKEPKTKPSAAAGATKKGSRSKKDPAAPKRPLSAYMFFSQDWRERVKTENPEAGFGDVGRLLGAKWKEMSAPEKKPYNDMATRDKARAEAEKEAYNANGGGKSSKSKAAAPPVEEDDDDEDDD